MVMEANVNGVSTWKVDRLVEQLGGGHLEVIAHGHRRGRGRGVLDVVPARPAGLRLVVADHHQGLKYAIARVLDASCSARPFP